MISLNSSHRSGVVFVLPVLLAAFLVAVPAFSAVVTLPTTNSDDLGAALHPTGLTINSISVANGQPNQFGTFSNFRTLPVTIRDGIVLSSGDVTNLAPFVQPPGYSDPASGSIPNVVEPPPQVNNMMDPNGLGGTPEFDAYGSSSNGLGSTRIENFQNSHDVAALRVNFNLASASQVKFDFIFGSVEYPFYTSSFTDSFLVFLDGTDPSNQITFDANKNPVQVGVSFANLVTTADQNTAFSSPHGLIHHLTTTTAELSEGNHTLLFEVGDVNDPILDSAAFITSLRAQAGVEGTEESEDYSSVDPVPLPAAAWMGMSLLGFVLGAHIRRRLRAARR